MTEKEKCPRPSGHKLHMCAMKQQGLMEEIDKHSAHPTVVCSRCGAKANSAEYLCTPRPL
jgi:hypothetical protein